MFNIIKNRLIFYLISLVLILASVLAIVFWRLNLSVDFKGGAVIELLADNPEKHLEQIKEVGDNLGIKINSVRLAGEKKIILQTPDLNPDIHKQFINDLKSKVDNSINEENYKTVGPIVSRDLTNKAILAVIIASFAIILYISFAFRKVPKPQSSWRFGLTAIAALIHDLIITTGFVSVVGHFYSWMQVDSLFITALLTIMGFSVHDTIVVFDRLRENLIRHPGGDIEVLANDSVIQTLSRSINTSLTTILVLLALLVIGGESINHFILTLIAGITIGTYSSIFIATALLVTWDKRGRSSIRQ